MRADKIASARVSDKAPVEVEAEKVSAPDPSFDEAVERAADRLLEGLPPPPPGPSTTPPAPENDELDYSPSEDEPGEPSSGSVPVGGALAQPTKVRTVPDQSFLDRDHSVRRSCRFEALPGKNQLVEYCCDDDSEIGLAAMMHSVDCLRLTESTLDLAEPSHVEQVIGQLKPGAFGHFSLPCTHFCPWQRMNTHRHGAKYVAKLKKRQQHTRVMLGLALQVAAHILEQGGHVSFEWPANNELWQEPLWLEFEERFNLRRVYFHGCSLGVKGKEKLIKKPWAISTTSLRVLQLFGQHQCSRNHEHEQAEGSVTKSTGHYTPQFANTVIEALFPQQFYRSVPAMCATNALVTKNLSKSEWLKDAQGVSSVQKEAEGLRNNQTWDDESVRPLWQLRKESRETGQKIKIAELLTLCGIKHFELGPQHHKYKGRIVYRGDYITDASGNQVFFDDTATTPTGLVGLGVTLFYGLRPGHATSCSDAVQAYLQALIGDGTWVVIPPELWLPSWHDKYPPGTKLVVRLLKSLYGHPESGRRWQQFLERHLRELGGKECPEYPSNWLFHLNGKTLILNIYVDDLTLSGPAELHQQFWHSLRARVKLDPEVYVESGDKGCRILGRHHSFSRDTPPGVSPATCEFDMRSYAAQLVEFYCEVAGVTKEKLRNFPSPCYPENQLTDADLETEGELRHVASRILMRGLWLSRLARPDLSFAITRLASRVTKWTKFEDRQLMRCISYLHHTTHLTLRGEVSQTDLACSIEVFTDADFASCPYTAKSTTGIIIMLRTGDSYFPVHWLSKKQSSTARSTTEAETIALATAMFSEVENLQAYLEVLLNADVSVSYQQDNETVLAILKAGYSAKLRHMNRVHRVNVASICERLAEDRVQATYCSTKLQRANGFTKVISPQEWPLVLTQLCLLPTASKAFAQAARAFPADALELPDPRAAAGCVPRRPR